MRRPSVVGTGKEKHFTGRKNSMPVKWAWEMLRKNDTLEIPVDSPHTRTTIRTSLAYFVRIYDLNWAFTIHGKGPFVVTRIK